MKGPAATLSPLAQAPALEMVDPRRVSEGAPPELVHAVSRRYRRQLHELLGPDSHKTLVSDYVSRFETLMEDPRDELKRRFPVFFRALVIVTDWRYRLLCVAALLWEVAVTTLQPTFCPGVSETIVQNLIDKLAGFSYGTMQVFFLLLLPLVYTGKLWGSGVRNDGAKYEPCDDVANPRAYGFVRLLECQLRLLSEGGGESSAPREGWGGMFFCQTLPICYCIFWVVLMVCYTLDAFAKTNIMHSPFCHTKEETTLFFQLHLFLVVDTICWSLPAIGVVVGLYGLHLGCAMCSAELFAWIARYRCLKDVGLDSLPPGAPSLQALRKDCYERYLLIHHIFASSSRIWSTFLLVFSSLSLLGGILYFVLVVKFAIELDFMFWFLWLYLILYLLEFTLPILLIAQANAPHRFLADMFVWSVPSPGAGFAKDPEAAGLLADCPDDPIPAPASREAAFGAGDYALIGGRREWLVFLQQAPCTWDVAGVPVTYEKLSAVVFSAALSVVVSVLPRIFQAFQA